VKSMFQQILTHSGFVLNIEYNHVDGACRPSPINQLLFLFLFLLGRFCFCFCFLLTGLLSVIFLLTSFCFCSVLFYQKD
jgi:hypothetical protein